MKTAYELFLPEVTPYVRDVPELLAVNAVRNAVIQFCEKSLYLQRDLDPQYLYKDVADYDITPEPGYVVCAVLGAWNADQFLIPKSVDELNRIYRMTNWRNMRGNPYYYLRGSENMLTLCPTPGTNSQDASLVTRVAITPSRASTSVDSDVYQRFLEVIAMGARARLHDTPNQPFTDPAAAAVYTKRFNDAVADVQRRVNKSNTRAASRVEFQRFA